LDLRGRIQKLHNEKCYNLYCLPDIIKATKLIICEGHEARTGKINAYKILVKKP